jgi:CHRD domain
MKTLGLTSLALFAALFLAVSAVAATKTLTTSMTGKAETPKGDSNGKGTAKFTLNTSTGRVCFKLTWSGIGTPNASHIHKGKKGVAGNILVPLIEAPGPGPKFTGCEKNVARGVIRAILRHPRRYYVNVHTMDFLGGEIRGQLHKP